MRLFALIFGLALALVQVVFIAAYFRWLGDGWPLPAALAILLVGVPAVVTLLPEDWLIVFLSRHLWLGPIASQTQSSLWQAVNVILVGAGASLGFRWPWWQAALIVVALLIAPQLAGALIRRFG